MAVKIASDARVVVPNAHQSGRVGFGKAACGVLIIDENGTETEYAEYLGEKTVPEAEFRGLLLALDKASAHTRNDLEIWLDSDLVVKWMTGVYRLKKDHIKPLFDQAKNLEKRYRSVKYFHHARTATLAKRADDVARKEYERNQS